MRYLRITLFVFMVSRLFAWNTLNITVYYLKLSWQGIKFPPVQA